MIADEQEVVDKAYKWKDALLDHLDSVIVAYSLTTESRKSFKATWEKALQIKVREYVEVGNGRTVYGFMRIDIECMSSFPIIAVKAVGKNKRTFFDLETTKNYIDEVMSHV